MKSFRLLGLIAAVGSALAQNTSQSAQCVQDQQFSWMFNSLGQGPCQVAQYLGGACNNGIFHIPPLATDQVYTGPSVSAANECRCSSVFYSLLSACGLCQRAQTSLWYTYDENCTTVSVGMFPGQIPSGTAVPHWAYINVTLSGGFNPTYAQQLSDSPESTAGPQATSSLSSSSHKKSIAGPVASGVVGGVVFVALVSVAVLLLLQRRRKSSTARNVTLISSGLSPESKPMLGYQPYVAPVLYNPSDPRTFPIVQTPTTTGETGGLGMKPAVTGSSANSGRSAYYTGAPEV